MSEDLKEKAILDKCKDILEDEFIRSATVLYSSYVSYIKAGFTEEQAMALITKTLELSMILKGETDD